MIKFNNALAGITMGAFLFAGCASAQGVCFGANCNSGSPTDYPGDQNDFAYEEMMFSFAQGNNDILFNGNEDLTSCYVGCRDDYRDQLQSCRETFTNLNGWSDGGAAQRICKSEAREDLAECLAPFAVCNDQF